MKYFENPFFWTTIIATLINLGLYLINRRTFKLLYAKPKILIDEISIFPLQQDGIGGTEKNCYLNIAILNPSSVENLIIRKTLRIFPFGRSVNRGEANIQLPIFGKSKMHISLDYKTVKNYQGRLVILTLLDIKGRKIKKLFKLKNIE